MVLPLLLVLNSFSVTAGEHARRFESEGCFQAFSFTYPSQWEATSLDPKNLGGDCTVGLRPKDWLEEISTEETEREPFAIYIQITPKRFIEAAASVGFDFDGTYWIISRGEHPSRARLIGTKYWYGLRGDPSVRLYRKGGGYLGQSEITIFVLTKPHQASAIVRTTSAEHFEVLDRIVETFRFGLRAP